MIKKKKKTLRKLGIEGNIFNLMKNFYKKPTHNMLNGENGEFFIYDRDKTRTVVLTAFIQHSSRGN